MIALPKPEWDRILSAAQKNDAELIRFLVSDQGVDPNHANYVGQSALHVASLWGNVATVKLLLSFPTVIQKSIDAQNQVSGATPLHSAVQSRKDPAMNRVECVRLLVNAGADAQIEDMYDMTPLGAFKAMLEKGVVNLETETDAKSVDEMLVILNSASALADIKNNKGGDQFEIIPLLEAMEWQGLTEKLNGDGNGDGDGSQVDKKKQKSGMTAMYLATQTLHDLVDSNDDEDTDFIKQAHLLSQIILTLLSKKADPHALPKLKKSALDTSTTSHSTRATDILAMLYLICKALTSQYHSFSANGNVRGQLESVAVGFIQAGAHVSPSIQQMMHDSARRGNVENVKFWIETLGVDPNAQGRQGLTPLHFAARSGRVELVKWLLSIGDDDGVDDSDSAADGLPKKKVDLSITDDRGKTALDAALSNGHEEVISLLEAARE